MKSFVLLAVELCLLWQVHSKSITFSGDTIDDIETIAHIYYAEVDREYSEKCFETASAEWEFAIDINDETEKRKLSAYLDYGRFEREMWGNITAEFPNWRDFQDPDLLRIFKELTILGTAALSEDKLEEFNQVTVDMEKIYSTAKICSFENETRCDLSLNPDISAIMKNSRNEEELLHVWTQWRNVTGRPIKQYYERFVELSNEVAALNNFSDTGDMWLRHYESESFKLDVEDIWATIMPFYEEIHAYVRAKLRQVYGPSIIGDDGMMPAHLLGNMWAHSWGNVYSFTVPFPNKTSVDLTEQMKLQGYTPGKMFEVSDEFFTSLGLISMPDAFWEKSVIEKPADKDMVCHASAWDFCNGKDFRIKQCTFVNMEDLITVHHEMGHIQYYLQYKDQPYAYRSGANPGFHEAIGDTLALSVKTPKHLKEIGLLDESTVIDDYETSINFLFSMALDKIAFLPFSYIMDRFRWDIFDNTTDSSEYNSHWWQLRETIQGIKSPVERSADDFDAASKFHISANVPYIRYFVSHVIQFQFYRSLCIEAGQYDPEDPSSVLHNCDIYRSKEAGAKLASVLSMGSSKPWPETMEKMTGQSRMDASALREYFKPLEDWLKAKNKEMGETPGWGLYDSIEVEIS